jgi:metal iron transporter
MSVPVGDGGDSDGDREGGEEGLVVVDMKNHWVTAGVAWLLWVLVVVMDVATVVLVGLGVTEDDG